MTQTLLLTLLVLLPAFAYGDAQYNLIQPEGCPESEELSVETERIFDECAAEVEKTIMDGIDYVKEGIKMADISALRRKREVVTPGERRVTGCVLQCIFDKTHILEDDRLPSQRGLLKMTTEGVTDRGFFVTVSRAVDRCYSSIWAFRNHHSNSEVLAGQTCDIIYDVFFCIIEEIESICGEYS